DAHMLAHLLQYDSVHGQLGHKVETKGNNLVIDGKEILVLAERDPAALGWDKLGVSVVVESTGRFTQRDDAAKHLQAGAKKVVISAPGKQEDVTVVMGVNEDQYDPSSHDVFSNASCTTNCLAPVAKVLHDEFGIENGLMTTVHAYTNDQKNIDNPHKDLRRARSSAENIIPTSTGAAKALGAVMPELQGKLHGLALRVPVSNVSLVDLVVDLEKHVTKEEVNAIFEKHAEGDLNGILGVTGDPLVSS